MVQYDKLYSLATFKTCWTSTFCLGEAGASLSQGNILSLLLKLKEKERPQNYFFIHVQSGIMLAVLTSTELSVSKKYLTFSIVKSIIVYDTT